MSEEQVNFKVTDRRLFNADGTPRDVPLEEKPAEEKQTAPAVGPTGEGPQTTSEPQTAAAESQVTTEEEDLSDADDPASFLNFLMTLASNAASTLGMMEHPVTHQRDVDLEAGKHWIDILAMLEKKTSGNLTNQEQQILKGLLSDLRMQYVSLVNSAAAKAPRGFTGRDILGGS
jgi:hypothetical protein